MKLPLGALLTFVGYAVVWTGIMNLKVTYSVQGANVVPSGKSYTLMDAFTCGQGAKPGTTSTPKTPATPRGPNVNLTGPSVGVARDVVGKTPAPEIGAFFRDIGTWIRSHV